MSSTADDVLAHLHEQLSLARDGHDRQAVTIAQLNEINVKLQTRLTEVELRSGSFSRAADRPPSRCKVLKEENRRRPSGEGDPILLQGVGECYPSSPQSDVECESTHDIMDDQSSHGETSSPLPRKVIDSVLEHTMSTAPPPSAAAVVSRHEKNHQYTYNDRLRAVALREKGCSYEKIGEIMRLPIGASGRLVLNWVKRKRMMLAMSEEDRGRVRLPATPHSRSHPRVERHLEMFCERHLANGGQLTGAAMRDEILSSRHLLDLSPQFDSLAYVDGVIERFKNRHVNLFGARRKIAYKRRYRKGYERATGDDQANVEDGGGM